MKCLIYCTPIFGMIDDKKDTSIWLIDSFLSIKFIFMLSSSSLSSISTPSSYIDILFIIHQNNEYLTLVACLTHMVDWLVPGYFGQTVGSLV